MPVTYRYDKDKGLLLGTLKGAVEIDAYQAAMEAVFADPAIPDNADTLWDVRDIDLTLITPDWSDAFVRYRRSIAARRAGARIAYLIKDPMAAILTRMVAERGHDIGHEYGVFTDAAEAEAWVLANRNPNTAEAPTDANP